MKTELHPIFSSAVLIGFLLCTSVSQAQNPNRVSCPPDCTVEIKIPDNPSQPPVAGPEIIVGGAGATINFQSDGPAMVIFSEDGTPFVNPGGRPVYRFNVSRLNGRSLVIRGDDNPCREEDGRLGCKYIIVDPGNQERPPLDPYIIIR